MRGERHCGRHHRADVNGSSPHARGTLRCANVRYKHQRFIPACAGNAIGTQRNFDNHTVHPRMRGERFFLTRVNNVVFGSSPHARGTPVGEFARPEISRFIPACAGNATPPISKMAVSAVHPRMRGERRNIVYNIIVTHGSSPHARGTLAGEVQYQTVNRFIPACAGNAC